MARTRYDSERKAEALGVYEHEGLAEAVRRTGIPKTTIASWASRTGVRTFANDQTAAATEAHKLSVAQRKQVLADGLLADAERLRGQLFAPALRREVHTVSDGHAQGSHVEVVDVNLDQPTFGDKKAIMTAIAIATDKVLLLTGEATARTEHVGRIDPVDPARALRDELAERRKRAS